MVVGDPDGSTEHKIGASLKFVKGAPVNEADDDSFSNIERSGASTLLTIHMDTHFGDFSEGLSCEAVSGAVRLVLMCKNGIVEIYLAHNNSMY